MGAVLMCAGLVVVGLGARALTGPETPEVVVAALWLIMGLLAVIRGVGMLALARRWPLCATGALAVGALRDDGCRATLARLVG
ncbi:MAG: hypothetical protein OXG37_16130 [Actinomycetia bacterium]|nr:hypothetical protein [Actinomycetes bacterium]